MVFSFAHAQFVWDCKSEPGVRDIFAKIWGTDKLTVSFGMKTHVVTIVTLLLTLADGGTLAIPTPDEADHGKAPWPHAPLECDQDELFEVLGMPESEELVRLDGKPLDKALPKHIVKATEWDEWIDEDDEDLRILDFGEAFLQGD
ncbi:hypothetical protein APSETT445_006641 [Aspergillus pseudonomiae]